MVPSGHRAAIVGPEGTGKTTLLEDLAGKLTAVGHRVYAGRAPNLPRDFGDADIVCVDSAEVLTWWQWRALRRRTRGLVVTLHQPGRLPTLRRCVTDDGLLADILAELAPTLPATERLTLATELHVIHAGNLRAALRDCYDRWGRNLALPRLGGEPEFIPVIVAARFFQGPQMADARRRPELPGPLEPTLPLPTRRFHGATADRPAPRTHRCVRHARRVARQKACQSFAGDAGAFGTEA